MGVLQRFPLPYLPAMVLLFAMMVVSVGYAIPASRSKVQRQRRGLAFVAALFGAVVATQGSYQDPNVLGTPASEGQPLAVSWHWTILICLMALLELGMAIRMWRLHAHPFIVALLFAAATIHAACAEWDVMYSLHAVSAVPWTRAYAVLEIVAGCVIVAGVAISLVRYYRLMAKKRRNPADAADSGQTRPIPKEGM